MCLSRNLIIYWECPIQGCAEVVVEMCGTFKLRYRILDGNSIPVEVPNDTRCPRRFPLDINDDGAREYSIGCDPCSQHTDDEVAEFQRVQQLEHDAAWQQTVDGVVDWQLEEDSFNREMNCPHSATSPMALAADANLQSECAPEPMTQGSLSPQQWDTYHTVEEFMEPLSDEGYWAYSQ